MSIYFNLRIKNIVSETADAVTLVFEKNAESISYKPGQFLTFIIPIKGEKVRRSYSLSSSPNCDEELAITVKKIPGGLISGFLVDQCKIGDMVEVMAPMGTFTYEVNDHNSRPVTLIGAGSGITPLISIAKSILNSEPLTKVTLIYGNRNEDSVIFKILIEKLQQIHSDRFNVIHKFSQPTDQKNTPGRLTRGEIIKLIEREKIDYKQSDFFICGPEGMMEEAKEALALLNVSKDRIRKESFLSTPVEDKGEIVSNTQNKIFEVTIFYQGTEYKVKVPPNKSILESALDSKIDLPYSCQSGMCTACMGKCKNGKVHLDNPDGLSDKEIQNGYVLTCVGHPASDDVIIEID